MAESGREPVCGKEPQCFLANCIQKLLGNNGFQMKSVRASSSIEAATKLLLWCKSSRNHIEVALEAQMWEHKHRFQGNVGWDEIFCESNR